VNISIAIPTGALFEAAVKLLDKAGITHVQPATLGRRLLLERDGVRVILVRPADVPAYVDHGAADLGVVGKDVLWESPGAHYELLDLRFGGCRLVVAVPEDSALGGPETWPPRLRLGTKYPRATGRYMAELSQAVEIVQLHGSVELAPQVGLTDGIVDLTASGRTLQENHLRVVAEIGRSTARLIANQASVKTRSAEVQSVAASLRAAVNGC
jgi:ATP phosphoribosyltransferase